MKRSRNWQIYILFDIRLNVEIFRTLYRVPRRQYECVCVREYGHMPFTVFVHFWLEAIDFFCLCALSRAFSLSLVWLYFAFLLFPFSGAFLLYYSAIYCTLCRRLILTLSLPCFLLPSLLSEIPFSALRLVKSAQLSVILKAATRVYVSAGYSLPPICAFLFAYMQQYATCYVQRAS